MAYTKVGVGTVANDGTGDPIRTSFQTINANLLAMDTKFTSSSTLIIGDDPATLGTPAGFENTISTADASNASITIAPNGTGKLIINAASITTPTNTSLTVAPNGTGNLIIDADLVTTITDASLTITPNGTGTIILGSATRVAAALSADSIVSDSGASITLTPNGAGTIILAKAATASAGLTVDAIASSSAANITLSPQNGGGELVFATDRFRVTTAHTPASSKGVTGDTQGDVAWDSGYLYVCQTTWTDGAADIWSRTALTLATW